MEADIIETGDIQNQWDSEKIEGGGWEWVYSFEREDMVRPLVFYEAGIRENLGSGRHIRHK